MASLLFRPSFYKDLGSLKVKHHVNYSQGVRNPP